MSGGVTEGEDVRDGYKRVQLGPKEMEIPEEWGFPRLSDVVDVNPNYDRPERETFDYVPMDAVDEEMQTIQYWNQRPEDDCTTTWFKNGDTIYAKITPCAENGKIAFVDGVTTEVASGSTEFVVFSPDEGEVHPQFVFYLANLPQFRAVTISLMEGSTARQRIPTSAFKKALHVPVPPLPEQRHIAAVLSTADEEIRQTEEIIEKTIEIKEGLVRDLFSTGLKTPSTTTVRVGPRSITIPENWDVKRVDEIVADEDDSIRTGPFGSKLKKEYLVSEGVKVYEQRNVYESDFEMGDRYVSVDRYESELTSYDAEPQDVLITLQGTIGEASVVPDDAEKGIINQKLMRVRLDTSTCLPEYFANFFDQSPIANYQIEAVSHGAVVSGLNISTISGIRVPIPPLSEQRDIIKVLDSIGEKISKEREHLTVLQQLKRGLMQDLLTGEIRTPESIDEKLN